MGRNYLLQIAATLHVLGLVGGGRAVGGEMEELSERAPDREGQL